MGKGEIACHEQFLLFPQCFQKTLKPGLVWERVKFMHLSALIHISDGFEVRLSVPHGFQECRQNGHSTMKFFDLHSVSARMRPCGIQANKLGCPHISKHGMPDLALKNHIWPSKIDLPVYVRAKVQNCMGQNCIAYEN